MGIIQDPVVWERFRTAVLVHSARRIAHLAYAKIIYEEFPRHKFLGETLRRQLLYLPTVTRELHRIACGITDLLDSDELSRISGLLTLDPTSDRALLRGSADRRGAGFDARSIDVSPRIGHVDHYVVEKAFVQR